MSNYINKYLNSSAYDADNTKQYPNTALVGNDVVFAATQPAPPSANDWHIMANVNVQPQSGNSDTIQLFGYELDSDDGVTPIYFDPEDYFDYIKVDETSISLSTLYSNDNAYTLSSGTHTIKYKIKTVNNSLAIKNLYYFNCITSNEDISVTGLEVRDGIREWNNIDNGGNQFLGDYTTMDVDGNVILPTTFTDGFVSNVWQIQEGSPFRVGGNLTIKVNDVVYVQGVTDVNCDQEDVWQDENEQWVYCAGEIDEETGECDDIQPASCEEIAYYMYPSYTNLYVPSAVVSDYENDGWENVSAIQS